MNRFIHLALCLSFGLGTLSAADREESPESWYQQGRQNILDAKSRKPNNRKAKNVILFVGDGMGISTVTAARIMEGQLRGETGEENFLFFETFPNSALSKTYNTNQQTPDSAGTMTAMITGVKSKAGFISVNQNILRGDADGTPGNELVTLLEKAEIARKSTGIVSTARLTHATPACTYAHTPERGWESNAALPENSPVQDIAAQLIDFPKNWAARGYPQVDGPEVAIGGGRGSFFPEGAVPEKYTSEGGNGSRTDGRNLAQEWLDTRKNSAFIHDLNTFNQIDPNKTDHLFGLFENSHMQFTADLEDKEREEPTLSEMTELAIDILDNNSKGFFLLVEGGRIDHAHHAGNAYRALRDAVEFSKAVETAYNNTNPNDTLIVVTADHSHVMTMAGYPTRGNSIVGLVAGNGKDGEPNNKFMTDSMGKPYTTLGYTIGAGYTGASPDQPEGAKTYPHSPKQYKSITQARPDLGEHFHVTPETQTNESFRDHLQETSIPAGSETHGGEDVGIWATGPQSHLLGGTVEQHVIFHLMDYAFGFKRIDPFKK